MRLLFVASLVSFVAAAATFACTSSSPVNAAADAGKDAKPPTTEDDDDTVDTDPVTDDTDAGDTESDAGDLDATPTTSGDAGHACKDDSTPETEPNNDEAAATKLTPTAGNAISFCGQVAKGDTDVFTFKHPFTGGFKITPSGDQVKYTTKIGSQTFDGFPKNAIVNADDVWFITVTSDSEAGRSYAVRIFPN